MSIMYRKDAVAHPSRNQARDRLRIWTVIHRMSAPVLGIEETTVGAELALRMKKCLKLSRRLIMKMNRMEMSMSLEGSL